MEREIIYKFLKGEMPFEEFVNFLDDNMYDYIESLYQQILKDELLKKGLRMNILVGTLIDILYSKKSLIGRCH